MGHDGAHLVSLEVKEAGAEECLQIALVSPTVSGRVIKAFGLPL